MSGLVAHSETYAQLVWLVASLVGTLVLVALSFTNRWARAEREVELAERVIAAHEESRRRTRR